MLFLFRLDQLAITIYSPKRTISAEGISFSSIIRTGTPVQDRPVNYMSRPYAAATGTI